MVDRPDMPVPDFSRDWAERLLGATAPRSGGWNLYAYGASYTALNQPWHTAGQHWLQLFAEEVDAGTRDVLGNFTPNVTSYGVSSSRIINVLGAMNNESAYPNVGSTIVPGSKHPGTSTRPGLTVIDVDFNDKGHYASMFVSPVVPATITSANTRYLDGLRGMYRHALALASHETRIEQTAGTFTGAWGATNLGAAYASGNSVAWTSTAGAYVEFSVPAANIPQSGPLAGKVYVVLFKLDASVGTMSQITTTIDGGSSTNYTPNAWEQYVGAAGAAAQVNIVTDIITLTLPTDGAAHTVRVAHSGAGGQFMYVDNLLCASADPNPVFWMGSDTPPNVHASVFNAAGVNAWRYNSGLVTPIAKAVVAEFPNAKYVPSTMTSDAFYSGDQVHPNDLGMHQRAADAAYAARDLTPRLRSRVYKTNPASGWIT